MDTEYSSATNNAALNPLSFPPSSIMPSASLSSTVEETSGKEKEGGEHGSVNHTITALNGATVVLSSSSSPLDDPYLATMVINFLPLNQVVDYLLVCKKFYRLIRHNNSWWKVLCEIASSTYRLYLPQLEPVSSYQGLFFELKSIKDLWKTSHDENMLLRGGSKRFMVNVRRQTSSLLYCCTRNL